MVMFFKDTVCVLGYFRPRKQIQKTHMCQQFSVSMLQICFKRTISQMSCVIMCFRAQSNFLPFPASSAITSRAFSLLFNFKEEQSQ